MLELVLFSGRDGAQDPGFCLLIQAADFMDYYDWLHESLIGWL